MAEPDRSSFDALTLDEKRLVNDVCERFEDTLRAGSPGRIPDYLDTVPPTLRPILFAELLRLECDYRDRLPAAGPASRRLGPFLVGEEVGRGGFGVVYRATDTRDGRCYALKVPHATTLADPQFRERFLREAEATDRLEHPNIVQKHQAGADGQVCFLAAEYVDGPTLSSWLADRLTRGDPITPLEAASLTATLADAVHHAHTRRVLHLDLKPSNVLLQERPGSGQTGWIPKVADFGLARLLGGEAGTTRSGVIAGTPDYMAPEQILGRGQTSPRTDIYALGAILYELLVGRPPFSAPTAIELLFLVTHAEPAAIREIRGDVPADLEAVCLCCLEKSPGRRYASAAELAEDVRSFLDGRRTLVRPRGPFRRAVRWARQYPVLSMFLASVAFIFLGSIAGLLAHVHRLGAINRDLASALSDRDASNHRLRRVAYAVAIRHAAALLDRGEVAAGLAELCEYEPGPEEEDLRGWEWYYLRHRIGLGQRACWPTAAPVYCLAFSRDGQVLAGGGRDGLVHVWDQRTGQDLISPLRHPAEVNAVAWMDDDQRLVTGGDDGVLRVWPRSGGNPLELRGHDGKILSIAISPQGPSVVTAGKDGTVRVWNLARQEPAGRILAREKQPARVVSFSPDGKFLIVGWDDDVIRTLDAATGLRTAVLTNSPNVAVSVNSFPGTPRFVLAGRHGVQLWEWDTAAKSGQAKFVVPVELYRINGIAMSADGRTLVVAGDGEVEVWDLDKSHRLCRLCGHQGRVWASDLHPNGQTVATAGEDGTVRLWSLKGDSGIQQPLAVTGRFEYLAGALLSGRQGLVVSWALPRTLQLWSWEDGELSFTSTEVPTEVIRMAPAPNGEMVAFDEKRQVWSFKAKRGGEVEKVRLEKLFQVGGSGSARLGPPPPIAAHPLNHWLAIAVGRDIEIREMSGKVVSVLRGHDSPVTELAFAPNGSTLASGSKVGGCLWEVGSEPARSPEGNLKGGVSVFAYSRDGGMLASGGDDRLVRLWGTDGSGRGQCYGHGGRISSLDFAADDRTLASGSYDGCIRLWQAGTGNELLTLPGLGPVLYMGFSSDGRYIVSVRQLVRSDYHIVIRLYDCGRSLDGAAHGNSLK